MTSRCAVMTSRGFVMARQRTELDSSMQIHFFKEIYRVKRFLYLGKDVKRFGGFIHQDLLVFKKET